jgi:hypothetical protein
VAPSCPTPHPRTPGPGSHPRIPGARTPRSGCAASCDPAGGMMAPA